MISATKLSPLDIRLALIHGLIKLQYSSRLGWIPCLLHVESPNIGEEFGLLEIYIAKYILAPLIYFAFKYFQPNR